MILQKRIKSTFIYGLICLGLLSSIVMVSANYVTIQADISNAVQVIQKIILKTDISTGVILDGENGYGYIKNYILVDASIIDSGTISNWNTAHGWGDHDAVGYLTTETDPVFIAWDKSTGISIIESQISDLQAYLTAETDPTVQANVKDGVTWSELTGIPVDFSDNDDADTIYTHPTNHLATVITQDSTHRFATDAEKTNWNTISWSEIADRPAGLDDGDDTIANTDTQDLTYTASTDVISLTNGGSIDITEVDTTIPKLTTTEVRTAVSSAAFDPTFGDVTADAYYYSSDIRYKTNIHTIGNALDKILALDGYYFDWKKDGTKAVGLIAQKVEEVFPELVGTNSDGYKSVQYGNLVAPLIEAVKELDHKNTRLEQENQDLYSLVYNLKTRIEALESK